MYSQEDELFSHVEKRTHVPCALFTSIGNKRATGNQTMLGFEPLTWCCYSNSKSKMDVIPSFPCVPKSGACICFPYPARQVSNSWRTLDGFFLLKRKGKVTWCFFYCTSSKFLSKHTFLSTYYPEWLSQHMTSVSDKSKDWVQIVLDFRTNNNIKYVKINFTLPVIIDAKSAKFVSQSWNKTWTQHMKHIANHFSAGLFLSKNTHDHRANHSCENSSGGWVN